jgi:hypothetical protein
MLIKLFEAIIRYLEQKRVWKREDDLKAIQEKKEMQISEKIKDQFGPIDHAKNSGK